MAGPSAVADRACKPPHPPPPDTRRYSTRGTSGVRPRPVAKHVRWASGWGADPRQGRCRPQVAALRERHTERAIGRPITRSPAARRPLRSARVFSCRVSQGAPVKQDRHGAVPRPAPHRATSASIIAGTSGTSPRSAADQAATTPSTRRAAARSTDRSRPCATPARTKAASAQPGTRRSATKHPRPVTSLAGVAHCRRRGAPPARAGPPPQRDAAHRAPRRREPLS